jgi:hypothetical protein
LAGFEGRFAVLLHQPHIDNDVGGELELVVGVAHSIGK